MHSHIRCICSTFLCCLLLNVCSKRLHKRMQIHIGCICLTLTHCAFANVLSKHIHKKIFNYTRCICLTFLGCAFPFVLLNVWEDEDELEKSQHNIGILSVESYSCHCHHHCQCHHHRHRCCHRHRHLRHLQHLLWMSRNSSICIKRKSFWMILGSEEAPQLILPCGEHSEIWLKICRKRWQEKNLKLVNIDLANIPKSVGKVDNKKS